MWINYSILFGRAYGSLRLALFLAALLLLTGCRDKKRTPSTTKEMDYGEIAYQHRVSEAERVLAMAFQRLALTWEGFDKQVEPLSRNESVDLARMRSAHETLLESLKVVDETLKTFTPPSPPTLYLVEKHAGLQHFRDGLEKLAQNELAVIVRIMEDRGLPGDEKQAAVLKLRAQANGVFQTLEADYRKSTQVETVFPENKKSP
jgi:hypothetical protein